MRLGEIDLIARHRGVLVLVEVNTRSSRDFAAPEPSEDGRKRGKPFELAQAYLGRLGEEVDCRFEVLGIILPPTGRLIIRHIRDVFRLHPE